ncbi:MAG: hypothetical protein Harvfovirus7_26 [Harvfovirus sp.]|uniref:Uncharacterized protein n=1 Tax=Harvfovirus sp. TaxID=2487768 RepID=A0A3G5A5R3_9VIRU|nr:MAG: hypothetical protein Harvfovirus7_26 [Harvfovirus sp.]
MRDLQIEFKRNSGGKKLILIFVQVDCFDD